MKQTLAHYVHEAGDHVIDVRTASEYLHEHVPNSINIPLDEIENISYIIADKNARIYLYCQTGRHSSCAQTVLKYMGYNQVYDLGGIDSP